MNSLPDLTPPPEPPVRLSLGVTGHREGNGAFAANRSRIEIVLSEVLDIIADAAKDESHDAASAPIRLHSMLADGADLMTAGQALSRGWDVVAPLPFGSDVNVAVNALPATVADARALLSGGEPESANVRKRAADIRSMYARVRLFELADRDKAIASLLLASLQFPDDRRKADTFAAESSRRVEFAAQVMIAHSDLLIAIWDGVTRAFVGGTGHTLQLSLEAGAPVIWIDANAPDRWRVLHGPESLANVHTPVEPDTGRVAALRAIVRAAMHSSPDQAAHRKHESPTGFAQERWHARSNPFWHGYRRVEALFGAETWKGRFKSLRQTYEPPASVASGSGANLLARARALPGQDDAFVSSLESHVLHRFAWADGISSYLSDAYRGGMTLNFLLAPLAIIAGVAYLPFASSSEKWAFAGIELALLIGILSITITGQRRRWHTRWFETRRAAEYFRHASVMLLLGVVRAPSRWPRGSETSWPEWYARRGLREVGLPRLKITQAYLRTALHDLLEQHVVRQRDYHLYKANRLAKAHHRLDKLSEILFVLAVVSVTVYLFLKIGGVLHWWPKAISEDLSYLFTFLGVALPTLGGSIAGIRYFGDFERFAAISEIAAEKLSLVHARIRLLLDGPEAALDYSQVAALAHAVDDIVVAEIESWQAVFAGKHVAVPV